MQGIERSLKVIETVSELQPIGVSDLVKKLGVPKSTMQRTLQSLANAGWIEEDAGVYTRWRLTSLALRIGRRASGGDLRSVALGPMHDLRDATDETVSLQVRDGLTQLVQIERVDSLQAVRTFVTIGSIVYITTTSGGLAFLAALDDDEVSRVLEQPIPAITPNTVTDPKQVLKMVAEVRDRGYGVNVGQNRDGVRGVGAAVLDSRGAPIAAVGISVPESRFDSGKIAQWGAQVRFAAEQIGSLL